MITSRQSLALLAGGALLGAAAALLLRDGDTSTGTALGEVQQGQPLYWVAPMDPDYRRDRPGKSPMGMDLVPVYGDDEPRADGGAGTVTISAAVENNLGVRTASVQRGPLTPEINTVGFVQYDEDQLIHIHPRVEGWIEKLYVKASGDPVTQGEKLYALYSPQLVNAQEELVLALKRNNRRLIRAAEERLRALQLDETFIQELKRRRQVQQTVTFRAPKSGVLDNLDIREGFYVKPGLKLMSIGVLDDVWVEAEVFARQAGQVEAGLPVTMTLDYFPGRRWEGRVDYVYPSLNPQTRTLRVRLRFDNPEHHLRPHMYSQVTIYQQVAATLLLPREALIRTGDQERVVLALGEGRFKSVAVKIGNSDKHHVEILEGLEEGDRVVVSAQFLLDSESSKSSDFMRMGNHRHVPQHPMEHDHDHGQESQDAMEHDHGQQPQDAMEHDHGQQPQDSMEHDHGQQPQDSRMHHHEPSHDAEVPSAMVDGVINHIDRERRILNISRSAIEKWGRPAATLDFAAAKDLALHHFNAGDKVHFRFEFHEGEFRIMEMQRLDFADESPAARYHQQVHGEAQ